MKKNIFLALLIPVLACSYALAGDITPGSVPGSLNYQGRLERDNAPITGPIHLTFRIYTSATGGSPVYSAPEIIVSAAQGIFSASITPPWTIFSNASGTLYLEVQVESDVLSPREPLSSVAYALVAKKLEDGSYVKVTTLTTTGNVGIGTDSPSQRLTIDGSIKLLGPTNQICFFDNTCMLTANYAVVPGGLTTPGPSVIETGTFGPLFVGSLTFITSTVQRMVISDSDRGGRIGIGAAAIANPLGTLDIDGSLYVGSTGIYDRTGGSVTVSGLYISDGGLTGKNSEAVLIGQTNNVIALVSGGSEKMRVHSNGNVGIGTNAPAAAVKLDVVGDIRTDTGMRAGDVSAGAYTGGALANEIRTQTASPLLLQQSNTYNVGIGTNTPVEKLHVRGSIKADMGVIAATAAFSDSVRVDGAGNFYANSGHNMVYLSSTIIYGTLQVTGGVGSDQGLPGYLASTQTFTGQNTFVNQVTVSSDIITANRIGAGVVDLDFGTASKYLQIGDSAFSGYDAAAYIVSGAARDPRLFFYRGGTQAARFETQAGSNLALVTGGATRSLVDSTYYRIYNSVFWVSTGTNNNTPAIFVSSASGNVGIGTSVDDPNWKLTVNGNIRLASAGGKIIFSDGTSMATSSAAAATAISNNLDAVLQADADSNGSGSAILKAGALEGLILNSGGNVGIGTLYPSSKLNVRGGDTVLGTPSLGSGGSALEDIFVAGNIVVDGGIVQRSATQVQLSALKVAGNVYLSTAAGARTRIGSDETLPPGYTLDVNGDINAIGAIRTGGTTRITAAGAWNGGTVTVPYGGTGATTFTTGGILYGNAGTAIGATPRLTNGQLLIGDSSGEPTAATLVQADADRVLITNGDGSITLSLPQDINTTSIPTFADLVLSGLTGMLTSNGGSGVGVNTGATNALTKWTDANNIGASAILTDNGARLTVAAPADLTGSITTASSGTFQAIGAAQYSIRTSSGIIVQSGPLNMNSTGKVINLVDPSGAQDAATKSYVDNATGGGGAWGLLGNNTAGVEFLGTTGAGDDLVFKTGGSLPANTRMTITAAGAVQLQNALGTLYGGTGNTTGIAVGFSGSLAGDVTGTQAATVVGADSHAHTGTTISGLAVADFTSSNISNWTNNSGYITGSDNAAGFTGSLAGDVTGTQGATVVGANSHTHDGTTISGLAVADFTSSNISNWTNNSGYITGSDNAAGFTGSLAGDVTGTQGATVVGNDSHTHANGTITGGWSGGIGVRDSAGTGSCTITVANGIITGHNCP